jgi:predicted transposase YdaD
VDQFNWTPYERQAYFRAQIALMDEFIARQAERTEGKAEGKAEERIIIAKNCLRKGMAISAISEITGLLEEEVCSLRLNNA